MNDHEDQETPPADDSATACDLTENGKRWGLICTRPLMHDGDHVAHGSRGQEVGRWPQ